jgi:hypothetical protein
VQTLTVEQLLALRQQSQHLDTSLTDAVELAQAVCGLQAQDVNAALLSFRARTTDLTAADVRSAWFDQGKLVRTWCMRGTLHLVARDDLRWMLPLFGPEFIKKTKRRYEQLGLSEADCLRAVDIIGERLAADGALTREELAGHLSREGIPTEGQAIIHLIRRAALSGTTCYGPYRGGKETFILLDLEPSDMNEQQLWNQLARRYLAAFGPAQPEDLARWSGLSISKVRRAFDRLSDQLVSVQIEGQIYQMIGNQAPPPHTPEPHIRLLPAFDTYLLGYQTRDLILERHFAERVYPGGGLIHPTVLANNHLIGTWKKHKGKQQTVIQVAPFEPFSPQIIDALQAQAADIGRFLGQDITLRT